MQQINDKNLIQVSLVTNIKKKWQPTSQGRYKMNTITMSDINKDNTNATDKPVSILIEVASVLSLFLVTATIVLTMSLTWIN